MASVQSTYVATPSVLLSYVTKLVIEDDTKHQRAM